MKMGGVKELVKGVVVLQSCT